MGSLESSLESGLSQDRLNTSPELVPLQDP